jgi:hypothetical protein
MKLQQSQLAMRKSYLDWLIPKNQLFILHLQSLKRGVRVV